LGKPAITRVVSGQACFFRWVRRHEFVGGIRERLVCDHRLNKPMAFWKIKRYYPLISKLDILHAFGFEISQYGPYPLGFLQKYAEEKTIV
jgi:hypothetical protein